MKCDEVRLRLEEAEEKPPEAVLQHLQACPDCAEYAAWVADTNHWLPKALSQPPPAWQNVKAGLAARLERERLGRQRRRRWLWPAAAAALLLLALGVVVVGRQPGRKLAQAELLQSRLAHLQEKMKQTAVLEGLQELQTAFEAAGAPEAKSVAEDAELYVERILSLKGDDAEEARETLGSIQRAQITAQVRALREQLGAQSAPAVAASLEKVATALAEANELAGLKGGRHAN